MLPEDLDESVWHWTTVNCPWCQRYYAIAVNLEPNAEEPGRTRCPYCNNKVQIKKVTKIVLSKVFGEDKV